MNPKQFLRLGGLILIVLGVLGFMGVIGPTPDQSVFGESWYFDNGENWVHLILGVVALIAAFPFNAEMQKWLVVILGVVGVLVAIYNLFSTNLWGANLESPADLILHLVVGVWALAAGLKKPAMMSAGPTMTA